MNIDKRVKFLTEINRQAELPEMKQSSQNTALGVSRERLDASSNCKTLSKDSIEQSENLTQAEM